MGRKCINLKYITNYYLYLSFSWTTYYYLSFSKNTHYLSLSLLLLDNLKAQSCMWYADLRLYGYVAMWRWWWW